MLINVLLLMYIMHCLQGITQSVAQGQMKLAAVSELAKITFRNTTEDGCDVINAELKKLDSDYTDIRLSVQVAMENVRQKLNDWVNFWKKTEVLNNWVRNMELKLGSGRECGKDLVEKKLLLEQMKVLKYLLYCLDTCHPKHVAV